MVATLIERLLIGSANLLVRDAAPQTDQGRQSIYVANHTSHLDALLLLAALPPAVQRRTRPLAAADYWNADPLRRYVIHSVVRGVLIDRNVCSLAPLQPALAALAAGDSLIFFPEGTRGPGGDLQPLKNGIFYLARAFPGVDIIPAWIDNSHRLMPRGAALPLPGRCGIRFGAPLRSSEAEPLGEFMARLRKALEALRPA
jgi:1-acyl-sn-glycerol-3-phosphate acyltransferase